MPGLVALVDDLFFQSKLLETAKHVGVDLRICTTSEALTTEISKSAPRLVVVDLNARSGPLEAIRWIQSRDSPIPVVAYLSHVQRELADQAVAAGCQEIMPRSKFTRDMATILARAKSEPS